MGGGPRTTLEEVTFAAVGLSGDALLSLQLLAGLIDPPVLVCQRLECAELTSVLEVLSESR